MTSFFEEAVNKNFPSPQCCGPKKDLNKLSNFNGLCQTPHVHCERVEVMDDDTEEVTIATWWLYHKWSKP
jgi:hypothetical protein